MSEIKHSLQTGTTSTRDEVFAAACVTLGIELKHDTPGVDNVYDRDKPYAESAGGRYAGTVNYYLSLVSPAGVMTGGLLKYWGDPTPVEKEMADFPLRLNTAHTAELRKKAAADLREILPCVALIWMRKAARETPRAVWHRYGEPDAHEARAWEELEALGQPGGGIETGTFDRRRFAGLFVPAMHAAVKTFFLNALALEEIRRTTYPAMKIEREGLQSIPFVITMSPGWRERMAKLNPLAKR